MTPTCRHIGSNGQVEQRGIEPVQTCLPKGTSKAVDLDPISLRELLLQRRRGFFRGGGRHIAPTVRDPVHMDVHPDPWLTAGDAQHQMGAFDADPTEGKQCFQITRQFPAVFGNDPARQLDHLGSFCLPERGPIQQRREFRHAQGGDPLRRACPVKEPLRDWHGILIPCAD